MKRFITSAWLLIEVSLCLACQPSVAPDREASGSSRANGLQVNHKTQDRTGSKDSIALDTPHEPTAPTMTPPPATGEGLAPREQNTPLRDQTLANELAAEATGEPCGPSDKIQPADGEELQARAAQLLRAIATDDYNGGDAMWFPKKPFRALKAVENPDKYWDQLYRAYRRDIQELHARRKNWNNVEFSSFELGSSPKWVPPGKEANHIGYYRSLHSKLHYRVEGRDRVVDVHTIITCNGRWYVTHLNDFKK